LTNTTRGFWIYEEKNAMKAWKVISVLIIVFFCMGVTSAFSSGDSGDWKYGREITIREQSGTLLDFYSLPVTLNAGNFDFSKANPNGSDIRVTDHEGYERAFWIEEWNSSALTAKLWISVPRIPANGEVAMRLYYGNPKAESVSNGGATFLFFDDFNRKQINFENWIPTGNTIKQEYGYISLPAGTDQIRCMVMFSRPVMMQFRYRAENGNNFPASHVSLISSQEFVYGGNGTAYSMKISNNLNSPQSSVITKGSDSRMLGGSPSGTVDTSIWNTYTLVITDKTLKPSWGGVPGSQVADDSLKDGTLVLGTVCDGRCNGYADWDWLFVRKYAQTEPAVTISPESPASQLLIKAQTRIPGMQDTQTTQKSPGLLVPGTLFGAVIANLITKISQRK
jgi:hypothetical protein